MCRYIGEYYSKAQEKLEDEMREFYRQDNTKIVLTTPSTGQLTAVHAEEEDEILRAQVCEVMPDKVKVCYEVTGNYIFLLCRAQSIQSVSARVYDVVTGLLCGSWLF